MYIISVSGAYSVLFLFRGSECYSCLLSQYIWFTI